MTRPLTPGDRVLVLASRLDLAPAEAAELAALVAAGLDWDRLLEDGRIFGIRPLLHRHLAGLPVPAPVRKALATAYHLQSMKSLQMFGALGRAQAALAEAGLPAKLLQGAHLVPWLYQDIGLRPMGDLDLLIHPGHRAAVTEVLGRLGFQSRDEDASVYNNPVDAELMQRLHHPPPLFLDRVCRVELHLNILLEDHAGPATILDRHIREEGSGFLYSPAGPDRGSCGKRATTCGLGCRSRPPNCWGGLTGSPAPAANRTSTAPARPSGTGSGGTGRALRHRLNLCMPPALERKRQFIHKVHARSGSPGSVLRMYTNKLQL